MEITINLPDKVFENVAIVADKTRRRIDEIITEKIEQEFSDEANFEEQAKIIEQSVKFCSDKEVLELANLQNPKSERLNKLFKKIGKMF